LSSESRLVPRNFERAETDGCCEKKRRLKLIHLSSIMIAGQYQNGTNWVWLGRRLIGVSRAVKPFEEIRRDAKK